MRMWPLPRTTKAWPEWHPDHHGLLPSALRTRTDGPHDKGGRGRAAAGTCSSSANRSAPSGGAPVSSARRRPAAPCGTSPNAASMMAALVARARPSTRAPGSPRCAGAPRGRGGLGAAAGASPAVTCDLRCLYCRLCSGGCRCTSCLTQQPGSAAVALPVALWHICSAVSGSNHSQSVDLGYMPGCILKPVACREPSNA